MTDTHLIHDLQDSRGVSFRIICSRRVNTAIERPDAHERIRFETVPEYRLIIVLSVEVYYIPLHSRVTPSCLTRSVQHSIILVYLFSTDTVIITRLTVSNGIAIVAAIAAAAHPIIQFKKN